MCEHLQIEIDLLAHFFYYICHMCFSDLQCFYVFLYTYMCSPTIRFQHIIIVIYLPPYPNPPIQPYTLQLMSMPPQPYELALCLNSIAPNLPPVSHLGLATKKTFVSYL